MKILVIGGGGREHAIVWSLINEQEVEKIFCAPGNGGIGLERLRSTGEKVQCVPIGAVDMEALEVFALQEKIDLTIVSADDPLALGIVNFFQAAGLRVWGPTKDAARFEWSKCFTQEFALRYGIPIAPGKVFSSNQIGPAKNFAAELGGNCVVKKDGLSRGKGAFPCHSLKEAEGVIDALLAAVGYRRIVIQRLLPGREVSLHAFCGRGPRGMARHLFPSSHDYKRLSDGDRGDMTGGMGAYSPASSYTEKDLELANDSILKPWACGCRQKGIEFTGVLYPGIMVLPNGTQRLLEFNARFGDPETQVYLTRLKSGLLEAIEASLDGTFQPGMLRFGDDHSVCVVLAAEGYPRAPVQGARILGLDEVALIPKVKVFHAGTRYDGESYYVNGGRVLGVTAWGESLRIARDRAYAAVDRISFRGMQFRRDIAHQ